MISRSQATAVVILTTYFWLVAGCQEADRSTTGGGEALGAVLGGPSPGFAQADRPRSFLFPADHGAHPDFRSEWWYLSGWLSATDGRTFGFQYTQFRYALAAPTNFQGQSPWRGRQAYMAHIGIVDPGNGEYWNRERRARGALRMAGAAEGRLDVWLGDWRLSQEDQGTDASQLSAQLSALAATTNGQAGVVLRLVSEKPVILHGDSGLSHKNANLDGGSYYYSLPRLSVVGEIHLPGLDSPIKVTGNAWLDREWSSGLLQPYQVGWDWFALQLDDGRDLMAFQIRNRDQRTRPFRYAVVIAANGTATFLRDGDWELQPLAYWEAPEGSSWPVSWHLTAAQENISVHIEAVVPDQRFQGLFEYWEGAVLASGQPGGQGYMELTGYGTTRDADLSPESPP